jgi:hypothetical protein
MTPAIALLVAILSAPDKGTTLHVRELALMTAPTPEMAAINKRVRFGTPKGWSGERHPNGRSLTLTSAEGKILVAAALHPEGLTPYLDELKKSHPAATPSPPEAMTLPGIKPERMERATRFVITGREVGEMVLIEKLDVIVLIVTVVDPNAWALLAPVMAKVYPTVEIVDVPLEKK